MNVLSNERIAELAPAVFASHAGNNVTNRFKFVPTIEVVDLLRSNGWFPVKASQTFCRQVDNIESSRHMIRFRRDNDAVIKLGDSIPELVLVNAHNGTTQYQLHAGLFRLVCSNGMVVDDGTFEKISVKHVGFNKNDIIEASYRVLENIPKLADSVASMQAVALKDEERKAFADAALQVRYGEDSAPIDSRGLLYPRRWDDQKKDLWTTLNTVQENIIRGGVSGRNVETRRRMTTRPIKSIGEDVRLNKALWSLAEKMKELKSVA